MKIDTRLNLPRKPKEQAKPRYAHDGGRFDKVYEQKVRELWSLESNAHIAKK